MRGTIRVRYNLRVRNNSKKKVAVFDIDGTLFRSSLLIELVEALVEEKIFPGSVARSYARAYEKWKDRQGPYEEYIAAVVRAFDQNIKGVSEHAFARVVRRVVEFHRNRLYRYTRDLVRRVKKKGYYLLAISHSPRYVVAPFAKRLGFNKVYARFFETDPRGRFTGKASYLDLIDDKQKILLRAVEKEHLSLKGSYGVGDTESDIRFLKMVEHPICFNPNKKLYRAARRYGWPVVVERKDMVYEINSK